MIVLYVDRVPNGCTTRTTRWALIRVRDNLHGKGRHVRKCRPTARTGEKRRFLKSEHNNQNSETIYVLVFTHSPR